MTVQRSLSPTPRPSAATPSGFAPSSSHAIDDSTAAATALKLNVGVSLEGASLSFDPPLDPSRRTGSGEPMASSGSSMASIAASTRLTSTPMDPTRLAPGDGVSRSASAVLNFFNRDSSSSSSRLLGGRGRLSPSFPPGDPGGDMSMPSTRTLPTTSAISASSFADFRADFGAGDSIPGFFLIGTSATDPGTDGGAGDRSPVTTASAHDDDPNVADSITRMHRNRRANAREAATARSASSFPSVSASSISASCESVSPLENTSAPSL